MRAIPTPPSDETICQYLDRLLTQGKGTEARINHAVSRFGVARSRVVRLERERAPLRREVARLARGRQQVPDTIPNDWSTT